VLHLCQVMSISDAMKFVMAQRKEGQFKFYLRTIGRSVFLRGATSDIYCFEKVFLSREYESPIPIAPETIVDGGANIGMATLYFASKFPAARILAIEPESANARLLRCNCEGLANVTIIEAALWPVKRTVTLSDPGGGACAFSVMDDGAMKKICDVATVTIQELCERLGGRIGLLKLDIEGAERELFSHDTGWLGNIDSIVVELHDRYQRGCAKALYSALATMKFWQEIRGENIFINLAKE